MGWECSNPHTQVVQQGSLVGQNLLQVLLEIIQHGDTKGKERQQGDTKGEEHQGTFHPDDCLAWTEKTQCTVFSSKTQDSMSCRYLKNIYNCFSESLCKINLLYYISTRVKYFRYVEIVENFPGGHEKLSREKLSSTGKELGISKLYEQYKPLIDDK